MSFDRVQPGEHHRLELLEPGKGLGRRARHLGNRVADLRVADVLDVRDEESDFAHAELVDDGRLRTEHTELQRLVILSLRHQPDFRTRPDRAFEDADHDHDTAIGVEPGVEDQRLQRRHLGHNRS